VIGRAVRTTLLGEIGVIVSGDPMPRLTVTEQTPGAFVVEVSSGRTTTTHQVAVPHGLAAKIGGPGTTDQRLVEESFRFLLEREANTSILRAFEIEKIGGYFPEWTDDMRRRLAT
jgi:hypothetical protein